VKAPVVFIECWMIKRNLPPRCLTTACLLLFLFRCASADKVIEFSSEGDTVFFPYF
jgi:hypothetical protein